MAVIEINGVGKVEVGPEFLTLSPDRQAQEVDAIVASVKGPQTVIPPEGITGSAPLKPGMSMLDVAKGAVTNAPASAVQFGSDLIQPIIHPVDTAVAIKNLGAGLLQKVGILSGDDQVKYADAVGKFFADRYGGVEEVKNAVATDPVGVLSDISMVLTGGGSLAARAPGIAGKVGEVVRTAGQVTDPLNAVGKAATLGGRAAAEVVGGIGTNTGPGVLIEAAKAGYEGGAREKTLVQAMKHDVPIGEIVDDARKAVDTMRKDRGDAYRAAMKQISQDATVLDFAKIDTAVQAVQSVKNYKGQDLSPTTQAIRAEITAAIDDWKKLDPKQFHTAEGLDALKQKIGDIRDGAAYGTPERKVSDAAYHAVRQTIVDQAPEYAKVMKGYEEASAIIKDIEKTLSLGERANIDTAVRKLQSTMRTNVNSNFGKRGELVDLLVNAGAVNLLSKIAGQSLNAWTPHGFGKLVAGGAGALGVGAFAAGQTISGPASVGLALASSPRIAGNLALASGRGAKLANQFSRVAAPSFQIGRASRLQP